MQSLEIWYKTPGEMRTDLLLIFFFFFYLIVHEVQFKS